MIWVAEIGSMHKGTKDLAYELIRQAAQAGATIAKFQFGWTEDAQLKMGLKPNPIRFVDEWAEDLTTWCDDLDIELMASIWSLEGLETARYVSMERYKIAAQAAGNYALCDVIHADNKTTFVSLDRHSPHADYHNRKSGTLIWCKSKYPTYPQDIAKGGDYPGMPEFGSGWTGYSDHMHGIDACLLAVARGAQYIEKHFCLDKTDLTVRDTVFSATPDEFAEMVRIGNGIRRLLDANV
jgi:N,N'-diacetyllegionaminate synthase